MKNSILIQRLVGVAALTALVVALQFLSNYVQFGTVSITLALIPIAVGAVLYGPLVGAFLGLVMGVVAFFAPSTALFISVNPWATFLVCLGKTGIAGLLSGLVFKAFAAIARKQSNKKVKMGLFAAGIATAALIVPPTNTFLFCVGSIIWFQEVMGSVFVDVLVLIFATNFLIEFLVSAFAAPGLIVLVKVLTKNYNLGFVNDFSTFIDDEEEETETLEESIAM